MGGSSTQANHASPGSYTAQRTTSGSSSSSPPRQSLRSSQVPSTTQNAMSTEVYNPTIPQAQSALNPPFSYSFSPIGAAASFDPMHLGDTDHPAPLLNGFSRVHGVAILVRNLSRNTSRETLRSMFMFAKEFIDADFITELPEESFLSAIVRFNTPAAAEEARAVLDGKPNTSNDAKMIVEMYTGALPSRRNTIDHAATRGLPGTVSTNGPLSRQSSRFNGTFSTLERLTTTNGSSQSNSEALPAPDANSRLHSLFSPQSPIGNGIGDFPRVSGKSVIDQDLDEDTGELLKDPVGYAQNGHASAAAMPRRSTNPQVPTNRFAGLSLTTNITSPPLSQSSLSAQPQQQQQQQQQQNYPLSASSRMGGVPTPSSALPPNINNKNNIGVSTPFHYQNQHTPRHSLPAANPNDLNPPCNTLYVGNLPADTSEEELKALFSKQRGYKRLCFRNKQNGPMCFVEFDEVAMASKALNELYGYKLSNSVKTGIRLSFSKNPLGVRSSQPGGVNPSTPLSPQGAMPGASGLGSVQNPIFSTASGPPPGLSAPPGLALPPGMRNGGSMPPAGNLHASITHNVSFNANNGLGIRTHGMTQMTTAPVGGPVANGATGPSLSGFCNTYPDYMMGR
ncbi:hypothetical protein Egran_01197 [Elaphomyces granulatus]|uniref:RRM domain-containing protein n=1 Tax=Elaphomyces granulatus TaxID=519963 RepID=A0A232M3T8_9EURO|nr:hypothetical protein Egran_01197 [Elaphomyces granulatus]